MYMILHVIKNSLFTADYIHRVNCLFDCKEHLFWVINYSGKEDSGLQSIKHIKNVKVLNSLRTNYKILKKTSRVVDSVILHSLFFRIDDLFIIATLIHHNYFTWVVWGGDLYNTYNLTHKNGIPSPINILRENLRKHIISNLKYVCAGADIVELKKRYDTKALNKWAFYTYPLKPITGIELKDESYTKTNRIRVMVGHSATPTCRHIEVFNMLKQFKGKIEIICPLSYPDDRAYKKEVIAKGKEIFEQDFTALTSLMPFDEYEKFLNTIDIGVFHNNRQQGNGNITGLLYLGKKVFLSSENQLVNIYREPYFKTFRTNQIDETFLNLLTSDEKKKNRESLERLHSDQFFIESWGNIFSNDYKDVKLFN